MIASHFISGQPFLNPDGTVYRYHHAKCADDAADTEINEEEEEEEETTVESQQVSEEFVPDTTVAEVSLESEVKRNEPEENSVEQVQPSMIVSSTPEQAQPEQIQVSLSFF